MHCDQKARHTAIRELLCKIVDQFMAREEHGPTELRQFERLAGDLIDVSDGDSVATLAEALCKHPETPSGIIRRLFDQGGASARIAFEFAVHAPVADIIANARHGSAELAAAIARRADPPREAVGALAARDEIEVLRALAANRAAHLDAPAVRALGQVARDDQELARQLLDRNDIDIDPEPLFLAATREERSEIVMAACRSAVISGPGENLAQRDDNLAAELDALGVARDRDAMIDRVAEALDARKSRVRKIFLDEGGEAIALTFVALGLDLETSTRLLLCSDLACAGSFPRIRALRGLMSSTPRRAALRIVAAINGSGPPEREAARRSSGREDAQAGAWRRGAGRLAPVVQRQAKIEQSA